VSVLWRYENEFNLGDTSASPSHSQAEEVLRNHPGLRDSVKLVMGLCHRGSGSAGSLCLLCFIHYVGSRINRDLADSFVNDVTKGIDLNPESPAYLLRERLIANRVSKSKLPYIELAALYVKAWNAYVLGKTVRVLGWRRRQGEKFPEIEAAPPERARDLA
jgi:hypothetical protein